jgi:hypothetical protein
MNEVDANEASEASARSAAEKNKVEQSAVVQLEDQA